MDDYLEEDDDDICTCDFDEIENCPLHYPIDDGNEDDDCMECGMCDSCIERTKAFFEEMEQAPAPRSAEPPPPGREQE